MKLSIIVPALDEAAGIERCLERMRGPRTRGHEVIVVDGGSRDATPALVRPLADRVVEASRGRATQMNAGAAIAHGEGLFFVHADTLLPEGADRAVSAALALKPWGRFDVRIAGRHPMLRVVGQMMNLRSRLSGIATGDQAMFVRRTVFDALGGYAAIPLMEDIEMSRRLRRLAWPACLRDRVEISGRRWESRGVLRTVALMWRLRLAYRLGADPARLAERYR
jgi:rSAM/selenodomain-associated transferase 2